MNSDVELRAVKPLAWQENGKHHPDSVWTGELFGLRTYYAIEPEDRVFRLERGWFLSEAGRDDLGLFPTRAEAERHANDDWQARLSPAIERQQVEGFVLVPRDITEEMWSAFFKARDEIFPEQMERLRSQGRGWKGLPAVVWEAMIAASPPVDLAPEQQNDQALALATPHVVPPEITDEMVEWGAKTIPEGGY